MNAALVNSDARVCAIVVSRIGDTLLVTPALRALRQRCAHLTVMAHPQRLEVLRHLPFIDELKPITKYSAGIRRMFTTRRFEVAICWGREPTLLRYCGAAARGSVAFDYPEFLGLTGAGSVRVAPPAESTLHAVRERALLAEAAGAQVDDLRLAYHVTPEEQERAAEWIANSLPSNATPLIGLQPFSFPTKAHRDWPLEHFFELARNLCETFPAAHVLVLGDGHTRRRVQHWRQALSQRVSIVAGELSLRESAALMQRLHLFVGVDTGPTHIAGALDIPMIAMYHPRYPGRNLLPLGRTRCRIFEGTQALAMQAIGVDEVAAAARELLAEPRG